MNELLNTLLAVVREMEATFGAESPEAILAREKYYRALDFFD